MTPLRLSIYMMLAAGCAMAADDPGGWTAARWGMTDAQILQAIPEAPRLDPPEKVNHARVHIEAFDLAGAIFHVYFVPGKDGTLDSVLLSPQQPAEGFVYLFQHLQELLVQKYGRPWTSKEGATSELQWSLKITTISLSLASIPAINLQILTLQYRKKSADLDKM